MTREEAQEMADELEIKYVEVSARTGEGVDEMFGEMATQICERWREQPRGMTLTTIVNKREEGSV